MPTGGDLRLTVSLTHRLTNYVRTLRSPCSKGIPNPNLPPRARRQDVRIAVAMQELTHAALDLSAWVDRPPETSRGEARASGTSSGMWDCLSAFGGDHEDEPESWSEQQPDSPQSEQDGASDSHAAQIEVREALSHREFEACFRHQRPILIRGGAGSCISWSTTYQ